MDRPTEQQGHQTLRQRVLRRVTRMDLVLAFVAGAFANHYLGSSHGPHEPTWVSVVVYGLIGVAIVGCLWSVWRLRQLRRRMETDLFADEDGP